MQKLVSISALALTLAALPAHAEKARAPFAGFASDRVTVPVMVNAGGLAGATFGTYVALFNPTHSDFDVNVTLWDSAGIAYHQTIELEAGELYTYQNFLADVFHFAGAGTVRFQTESGSDQLFVLNTEVYTAGSGGRFGTSVPGYEFPGTDATSTSAGISIDSHNRVNVGCFNESGAENHISATSFDASGREVSTVEFTLPAHAWGQRPLNGNVSDGYVVFTPSGGASCYAVQVQNATNDGRFVPAVEFAP